MYKTGRILKGNAEYAKALKEYRKRQKMLLKAKRIEWLLISLALMLICLLVA